MEGGVGREKATCDSCRSFNEHLCSTYYMLQYSMLQLYARNCVASRVTDSNESWTLAPGRAYCCLNFNKSAVAGGTPLLGASPG